MKRLTSSSRRSRKKPAPRAAFSVGWRALFFGLALSGLAISLYLLYAHRHLQTEPGYQSVCAINETFDCDTAILSDYGTVIGVPLPVFAAWFYLVVILTVMAERRGGSGLLFMLSVAAVGLSLWLAGISFLVLHVVCVLCAALYAINVALLIASGIALRASGVSIAAVPVAEWRYWSRRPADVAGAAFIGLMILLPILIVNHLLGRARPDFCDLVASARAESEGPMTLVVYSDFQCPHCRALDRLLRPLRGAQRLKLIPRQYPLDRACNRKVVVGGHPGSCVQARAALCAQAQGRYDDMSDRLYDERPSDTPAIQRMATSLGLDPVQFAACLASAESAQQLEAEIAAARADEVRSTPTLLLNGRRHRRRLTPAEVGCLAAASTPGP